VRGILGVVFWVWELVKKVADQAVESWMLEMWMEEGTSEMLYTRDQSHGASQVAPCGGRDGLLAPGGQVHAVEVPPRSSVRRELSRFVPQAPLAAEPRDGGSFHDM
jgi:hypothetical protein